VLISSVDTNRGGPLIAEVVEGTGGEVFKGDSNQVAVGTTKTTEDTLSAPFAWMVTGYIGYINEVVTLMPPHE